MIAQSLTLLQPTFIAPMVAGSRTLASFSGRQAFALHGRQAALVIAMHKRDWFGAKKIAYKSALELKGML